MSEAGETPWHLSGPVMQQCLEEASGECASLGQMGPDAIFL